MFQNILRTYQSSGHLLPTSFTTKHGILLTHLQMVLYNRGRVHSVTCEHRACMVHTKACIYKLAVFWAWCYTIQYYCTLHCVLFNVTPFTTICTLDSPATDWMLLLPHSSHIGWAWRHTSWCAGPCSSSGPSPCTAQMCTSPSTGGTGLSAPRSHCTSLPSCTPRWDRLHGVCSALWWQLCLERTM